MLYNNFSTIAMGRDDIVTTYSDPVCPDVERNFVTAYVNGLIVEIRNAVLWVIYKGQQGTRIESTPGVTLLLKQSGMVNGAHIAVGIANAIVCDGPYKGMIARRIGKRPSNQYLLGRSLYFYHDSLHPIIAQRGIAYPKFPGLQTTTDVSLWNIYYNRLLKETAICLSTGSPASL